jgi:leucyl aminopeptidase
MPLSITAGGAEPATLDTPLLVIPLARIASLPASLDALDRSLGGAIGRSISRRDFRGDRDELLHLTGSDEGPKRILLVGIGEPTDLAGAARRGASIASRQARKMGVPSLAWFAPEAGDAAIEAATVGLALGAWQYNDLKSPPSAEDRRPELESATILGGDGAARGVESGSAIAEGINLSRRLAMMPGNLCTPEFLADTARAIAERHEMQLTVLGRAELEAQKMGSFLAVAQGTPQDPKLIALEYRKGASDAKPLVLVGKGLCFDSGGISIKPAQGMEAMKFDMCGAAGVLGAMETIARLALPLNVVGLVGSTTNMPSGISMKPGDVVQASNGKFIEIINTDAEGRLVLADVLSYARRFDPAAVVDAATLTGACVVALGHTATGVFGNDESLIQEVLAAGTRSGELGWQLPLFDEYRELMRSDVADIKNSGGRAAGASTAAIFLKEFTGSYPWVHLDIAGTAYAESDLGYIPKGPTGIPVGMFVEIARGRAS